MVHNGFGKTFALYRQQIDNTLVIGQTDQKQTKPFATLAGAHGHYETPPTV